MKKLFVYLTITALLAAFAFPCRAETDRPSIIIVHKGSGEVVLSENADERRDAAGLTHLPALLVLSEAVEEGTFSLEGNITVSRAASAIKGSTAFLDVNEVISAQELYKAAVMTGAGDALYALCENMAGSAEKFTQKVNERLSSLGISLAFSDITGAGEPMSCADIARIASALSACECYLQKSCIYMDKIVHTGGRETELVNQNRLIRNMQGCRGLYTGSSKTGGYSGAFYTDRGGCEYICVIIGAKNSASRFERVQSEVEACFNTYHEKKIAEKGKSVLQGFPIDGATVKKCDLVAADDYSILLSQGEEIECVYNVPERLCAPVKAGDCVGNALFTTKSGERSVSVELTVKEDIEKAGFLDFLAVISRAFLGI